MKTHPIARRTSLRRAAVALAVAAAFGAAATPAGAQVDVNVDVSSSGGWLYDLGAVVSLFVDPPVAEPQPVAVAWAPPPMLVEDVPPQPDPYAVWTGGYWTWQGDWVWCAGRWSDPPRETYVWVQPYYEHRDDRVVFIPGYWSAPDVEFIAPPMAQPIAWAYVAEGVVVGPPPMGPPGIFVPPPPGSRPGIIVPAPIGTPPAVVISAPPVMAVGMRVSGSISIDSHNTVINDNRVTNYSVTNVRNVTNVTVQAPASAMASGRAFQAQVPHQAHLAAALHPVVAARAPVPATRTPVAAYVPGRPVTALPKPQRVQGLPSVPQHAVAAISHAQAQQMGHAPMTPEQARQQHAAAPQVPSREAVDPAAANAQQQRAEQEQRHVQAEQAQRQQAENAQQAQRQQAEQAQRVQQDQRRQQAEQAQRQQAEQGQQRAQQEQRQQQAAQAQRQQAEQAQQRAQQEQRQQQAEQAQRQQAEHAQQQQAEQAQRQQGERAQQQQAGQQRAQQEHEKADAQRAHERPVPHQDEASRPAGRE
jgi:DNA segregation ATPase FtsK/SpoIIIE-like protein